ncbi:dethiobiotin synthase [Rubrolithibacter danxiaensis]|uniref:dethiobiotin synthase n=1 Tax=Rubrolithibacter danxiaensis TaxID=3390805 RepID=UPI003BF7F52D
MRPIFITGIDTGIGKTIVSAILTESLEADYWKPVQSGDLEYTDTDKVKELVSNTKTRFYPEAYRLTQPFSPHKSADLDGIQINLGNIAIPPTDNQLIIEGAGGLMVPLNNTELMLDLIKKLDAEVVLVSRNYLGSINHTLLSIEVLKRNNIPIKALLFNGNTDTYSESFIINYSPVKSVIHIPEIDIFNKETIKKLASEIKLNA